jgi:hypothetical protein
VSFGEVTGAIDIMRIDKLGCTEKQPDCPVRRVSAADFGIQGDGIAGQGFAAILGIRPVRDSIDNPLRQLGVTQWIIDLPRPGHPEGRLILNPGQEETAGYQLFAFADEGGDLVGRLIGPAALGRVCGATYFDTGAPGLRVQGFEGFAVWPNGTRAALAITDGKATVTADIAIGRRDQASLLMAEPRAARKSLSFGLAAYFKWSVLYDIADRQIGLRARD